MSGKPIGLCGTVLRKFGDWEWMKNGLGLRGWQGGETTWKLICMFCAASKLYDPWGYDPSLEAGWRSTFTSGPEFWSQSISSKSYVSPLLLIPGFRLEWVMADWMHVCCLGILPTYVSDCVLPLWECLGGSETRQNRKKAKSKFVKPVALVRGSTAYQTAVQAYDSWTNNHLLIVWIALMVAILATVYYKYRWYKRNADVDVDPRVLIGIGAFYVVDKKLQSFLDRNEELRNARAPVGTGINDVCGWYN